MTNAFLHQGRRQKCLRYLNTEPKVMETPNLACGGCSLKFDGLNSFGELLTTARHRCNISLKKAVLPTGVMERRWAPQTRYMFQCNTVSVLTDLI